MLFSDFFTIMYNYFGEEKDRTQYLGDLFSLCIDENSKAFDSFDDVKRETLSDYCSGTRPIPQKRARLILKSLDTTELEEGISNSSPAIKRMIHDDFLKYNVFTSEEEIGDIGSVCCILIENYINAFSKGAKKPNISRDKSGYISNTEMPNQPINENKHNKQQKNKVESHSSSQINQFSEFILDRISRNKKYYVETHIVSNVINLLNKKHKLLIIGAPGIGKTTTTEMVAKHFNEQGFNLVFSDDIDKAEDILSHVIQNKDLKELIILDDCFGQIYYKLTESRQGNYICRLIRKISECPNKCLLMNSRVQIYNSAKSEETQLSEALQELDADKLVFEPDSLTRLEKAMILVKHLSLSHEIDKNYCRVLLKDKNYNRIIDHKNYTPRIMQYVTSSIFLDGTKPEMYMEKILSALNNPLKIWDDEYKKKLKQRDRIVLTTLYSITEYACEMSVCEKAYNNRIALDSSIDKSINNWKEAISLMNGSMIEIFISQNSQFIKVINPSVNDYLKNNVMIPGSPEIHELRKCITIYCQIDRLYPNSDEAEKIKQQMVSDKSVLKLEFLYPTSTTIDIVYEIVQTESLWPEYNSIIRDFINNEGKRKRRYVFGSSQYLSEPTIGKSRFPEKVLALLITNKKTYDFYMLGKYNSSSILNFYKQWDSISMFWESISLISNNKQNFFELNDSNVKEQLINVINKIIENEPIPEFTDQINSILEQDNTPLILPFSFYEKEEIEKKLIAQRIADIKLETTGACDANEALTSLMNTTIESFPYDFSYDVDEFCGAFEKSFEEEETNEVSKDELERYKYKIYEEELISESFNDLYQSKTTK